MDGVEVIHGLRAERAAPIIVLSGRIGGTDKVGALDAGADDYVTKPFGMDELMARIRAVARRSATRTQAPEPVLYLVGQWQIDLANHRITGGRRC